MDKADFHVVADETLETISSAIEEADEDGVLEVDVMEGVLTIELDDERQFVLNKHEPTSQLWLSSPISGASYYEYDENIEDWISSNGQELHPLLREELLEIADIQLDI